MWFSIADGGLLVSLLVALLLFRETPFLGSPTRSLASESMDIKIEGGKWLISAINRLLYDLILLKSLLILNQ